MANRRWREWEWSEYNKILAWISKIPYEVWQPNEEEYRAFLENENSFIDLALDALPVMPWWRRKMDTQTTTWF
jgi:hypothetical protein